MGLSILVYLMSVVLTLIYNINNSGPATWVTVILSVVFIFKHGISESNKDLKLKCKALMISDKIGLNGD